jgi:hypothetical protein
MGAITMSTINFSIALPTSGYERTFEAEIDCLAADELRVRGRMRDHRFEFAHIWRLLTPSYEVIDARADHLAGDVAEFDPHLGARYPEICGVRIGRGFSKRVGEALGGGAGHREHLLLAIEMARVGQQVYQLPPEFIADIRSASASPTEQARVAWLKDRAYLPDLANSCQTYNDKSEELFGQREIRWGINTDSDVIAPSPGTERVFRRRKRIKIEAREGGGFSCLSAMQDSIHDIEVRFNLASDGLISEATSRGLRLPYHGLCEDAQLRTPELNGLQVTKDFIKQFAGVVGGATGCTHLFDLSIDCLRLFKFMEAG